MPCAGRESACWSGGWRDGLHCDLPPGDDAHVPQPVRLARRHPLPVPGHLRAARPAHLLQGARATGSCSCSCSGSSPTWIVQQRCAPSGMCACCRVRAWRPLGAAAARDCTSTQACSCVPARGPQQPAHRPGLLRLSPRVRRPACRQGLGVGIWTASRHTQSSGCASWASRWCMVAGMGCQAWAPPTPRAWLGLASSAPPAAQGLGVGHAGGGHHLGPGLLGVRAGPAGVRGRRGAQPHLGRAPASLAASLPAST